jgi:hypothetical protein
MRPAPGVDQTEEHMTVDTYAGILSLRVSWFLLATRLRFLLGGLEESCVVVYRVAALLTVP